jgi:arylsulfatase A-like enzyme
MIDQMRGDFFGAAGCKEAYTPNLDWLANSGTRFNHAYTAVPSCLPARAILWSGQNQWHAGILGMGAGQGPVPNDFPHTLPGELTKAGYRTHMIGKGHFEPQRALMGFETTEVDESGRMESSDHRQWFRENANPNVTPDDHGVNWNSWHSRPWHTEEYLHPTHWTMSRALEFIDKLDEDRPFFLNISFARPHSPYVPPQYYFDLYQNKELPKPSIGDWADVHDQPDAPGNLNEWRDAWRGKMPSKQIQQARAGYLGEISFIDTQIGRLLNFMDKKLTHETRENTWIIFTSDHGDMQGDHHHWRKTYAYEGSARIPFIIHAPGNYKTKVRHLAEEVVELRDFMPTILELAGVEVPATVDGASLLPLLEKPAENWREYIHGEHCTCYSPEQEMQYVTDGKRKFIWLPRIAVEQFFDLENDPGEKHNLIDDPQRQDEIGTWRNYLIQELKGRDCGWCEDDKLSCPSEVLVSPYRNKRYQA